MLKSVLKNLSAEIEDYWGLPSTLLQFVTVNLSVSSYWIYSISFNKTKNIETKC